MRTHIADACKTTLLCLFCAACAAGILVFPQAVKSGAERGISYCLYTLIPSLFPFLVLSSYLTTSGLAQRLGKALGLGMHALFYLPGSAGTVLLMGIIGGYPVGARGCAALLRQGAITPEQARRILYFCVCGGPAFTVSVVGGTLLQSTAAGVLLFCAQAASLLALGATLGLYARWKKCPAPTENIARQACAAPLVEAVASAARGLLSMSSFVIVCAAFADLLHACGVMQILCKALLCLRLPTSVAAALPGFLLEITTGCVDAAALGAPVWLFAFGLGFGGICVLLQVLACSGKCSVCKWKFVVFRVVHGMLTALAVAPFSAYFKVPDQAVFHTISQPISGTVSYSLPAGIALVICCILFIICVGFQRKKGWK